MLISRIGPTAPLYTALPISKSFEVLRAFMRPGHTFQLSFTREPTNTRRKYLFSFEDLETRLRWAGTLQGQIQRSTAAKRDVDPLGPISPQVREAAEVVSLQVLRDALLPAEPDPAESKAAGKSSSHQRSASISQFYRASSVRAPGAPRAAGFLLNWASSSPCSPPSRTDRGRPGRRARAREEQQGRRVVQGSGGRGQAPRDGRQPQPQPEARKPRGVQVLPGPDWPADQLPVRAEQVRRSRCCSCSDSPPSRSLLTAISCRPSSAPPPRAA